MASQWKSTVMTVTTTAAAIGTSGIHRQALCLHNNGTGNIYLGDSNVTADSTAATGGFIIAPAEKVYLAADAGFSGSMETLYARVASSTQELRILERQDA